MNRVLLISIMLILGIAVSAQAIPLLQVGAPGTTYPNPPDKFADYQSSLTNPTETDTAVTNGTTLLVGGVYGNGVLNLGAQYGSGLDWSALVWQSGHPDIFYPTNLNTHGAILVASVPDGQLATALTSLKAGGNLAFFSDANTSWLPNPPSDHDPAKGNISDFLFFDIGNFVDNPNAVPNFVDETGSADGEIKSVTISGMGNLPWIHWDVMALETSTQGSGNNTRVVTNDLGNPGSHDVTWKPDDGGGGGGGQVVPEPGTIILLGSGLLGLALYGRMRFRK